MTARAPALAAAAAIGALLGVAPVAGAATYTVTDSSDSTAPCSGTTCPSLRSALAAAVADGGSTVMLGSGTYKLGNGANQVVGDGELKITGGVTLVGAGSGATTIQQTDGVHRVLDVTTGTVSVSGLAVTGGSLTGTPGAIPSTPGGDATGGGILNNGTLSLEDVRVTGNKATGGSGAGSAMSGTTAGGVAKGGGVATAGTLALSHSVVADNVTTGGGGGGTGSGSGAPAGNALGAVYVSALSGGPVTLTDSAVLSNTSTGGTGGNSGGGTGSTGGDATGGLAQFGQTLTLERSTVSGNTASGGAGGNGGSGTGGLAGNGVGGGIATEAGTLVVAASTVSGNSAAGGKGGDSSGTSAGNGGEARGGGIYALTGGTLVNTTVSGNMVTPGSGGHANNAGVTPGAAGAATGGGLDDRAGTNVTLASMTIAGNSSGGRAGNVFTNGAELAAADTIIAAGSAPTDSNCSPAAVTSDAGHNLDSTSQCGLAADKQDVVGADPLLGPLADNGGPTKTMAPGASSPALGAGGACTDPENGNSALTTDQRGAARTGVCDIGAFQAQRPQGSGVPSISGTPAPGQVLSCTEGAWTGDGPLSFAYAWLRDGVEIVGAVAPQYTVGADAGHQITCRATATSPYGSAVQTSAPVTVPGPVTPPDTKPPTISGLSVKPASFRAGRPTRVSFRLSETARATFTVQRRTVGHRKGKRCRAGRGKKRCVRYVALRGHLARTGKAGANRFNWKGRLGRKALRPGRYRLVGVAVDPAGNRSRKPARQAFRVLAARRS